MGQVGAMQYLRVVKETSWGVLPTSPVYVGIPVHEDGYTIELKNTYHTPGKKMGTRDKVYKQLIAQDLAGGIILELWPDNAEMILDWAMKTTLGELDSYTCEWCTPDVDTLRHLGIKVNSVAIAASEDAPDLILTMDCIGYWEEDITEFAVPSFPTDVPYIFQHGEFILDISGGSTISTSVESFTLTVNNNLTAGPHTDSKRIAYLETGARDVTGSVTVVYDTDDYNTWVRNATTGTFKATFTHPTVVGATVEIWIPNFDLTDAPKAGGPTDTIKQTLNFEAKKVSPNEAIEYTVTP